MNSNIKVVFVYKTMSPFIADDLRILQKHFDVDIVQWAGYFNIKNSVKLIKKIIAADVCFTWFENYRAALVGLLGKLFGTKTVLIAAGGITLGYEWELLKHIVKYSNIPGILIFSKLAVKWSSKVLAVSVYKKKGVIKHTGRRDIEVVPNCFDYSKFEPGGEKENVVLTICYLNSLNIKVKRLDIFIKAACSFPETEFIILGKDTDGSAQSLREAAGANVRIISEFPQEALVEYMQRAKVYSQLSVIESFGAALAEAMLCGCVPVVTERGNLPEVAGDTGFGCKYGDLDSTVEAIKKALASEDGAKARERVKTSFPLEKREEGIVAAIKGLFEG